MNTTSAHTLAAIKTATFLFIPILLCLVVFWPGLNSPFLFDDYYNLEPLSRFKQDQEIRFLNFIFNNGSGPSGRPVSMLSFLLNDIAWPSAAWSFKYTNLLLHLLNGLLLFWLTIKLGRLLGWSNSRQHWTGFSITLLWLCHPIQITSVLYVIQRMTLLSGLFTLLGLHSYLYFRHQSATGSKQVMLLSGFLFLICLCLATLSKENGISLLFYVCIVEFVLLRAYDRTKRQQVIPLTGTIAPVSPSLNRWFQLSVYPPLLLVFFLLIFNLDTLLDGYQLRDFTLSERLMTQTRVIAGYLSEIIYPNMQGQSIYHDDFTVSRSLLEPLETLAAIIVIGAGIFLAFHFRQKVPLVSFGILWYFAGHALESSILPLELYFDHRNYLPLYGLLFVLCGIAFHDSRLTRLQHITIAGLSLLACVSSLYNSNLWASPYKASLVWLDSHPQSPRTVQNAAAQAFVHGDRKTAIEILRKGILNSSDKGVLAIQLLVLHCFLTNDGDNEGGNIHSLLASIDYSVPDFASTRYNFATLNAVKTLASASINNGCPRFTVSTIIDLINSLQKNPDYQHALPLHILYYWKGKLHLLSPQSIDQDRGMAYLDISFAFKPTISGAIESAIIAKNHHRTETTDYYLAAARYYDEHQRNPFLRRLRKDNLDKLETLINRTN